MCYGGLQNLRCRAETPLYSMSDLGEHKSVHAGDERDGAFGDWQLDRRLPMSLGGVAIKATRVVPGDLQRRYHVTLTKEEIVKWGRCVTVNLERWGPTSTHWNNC